LITVSFADEIVEYSGDFHAAVTIIRAKLDGVEVTSGFTAESASTWSYRPADLDNDEHTLEVLGRDDAGNTHSPIVRVFSVDAPAPTPTPIPTETPTPAPTIDIPPTVEVAPTEVPSDASEVATADPEPSIDPEPLVPSESTPKAADSVEPEPVATPIPDPAESTAVPDDAAPVDPETAPTPDDSVTPAEEVNVEDSEEDIAATVAAMRAADDETSAADVLAPKPALTVFGCNVPTGPEEAAGAVTAGADYILMAAWLFGMVVARVRSKRRKDED
jgi:hypothetical protein